MQDFQHITKGNHLLPLQQRPGQESASDYQSNMYAVTTNPKMAVQDANSPLAPSYYQTEGAYVNQGTFDYVES